MPNLACYTHRNTVLYRIRKIQDMLDHDLSDPYTREYALLSIKVLYLYHWKKKQTLS
ncbi:helix-turn-helix domain-containing protein [Jingyaoa shaoxingensis]|uniref:Helix-turn-helix domain-containing protein n=1 Tax=Jingyaoa shaoxingensis TaxID=2763671 RepID=A0ABR7N887_9FIRM|nr:helix-turn-helix domain-containing protein [Jingyaoa shaoxingensis]